MKHCLEHGLYEGDDCPHCERDGCNRPARDREESSPCSAWVDAAALEKAWREGYASGYYNGTNDTARYECGGGSNKAARRDEDDEWNGSETKASTIVLGDSTPK